VADALSRRDHTSDQLLCLHSVLFAFSELIPQWVHDMKLSYSNDSWISQQMTSLQSSPQATSHYSLHQGVLRFKGRICVGNSHNWRQLILQKVHDSSQGGHSGTDVTYHRLKQMFYWPHMKEYTINYVRSCPKCQMVKPEHLPSPRLLQPLPILDQAWSSIGMDFITGLPKHEGKSVIMVVVDKFTKFAHFIPLAHPYTIIDVAHAFLNTVYKLHGLPTSIITDRDPVFTSNF
jgi:Integrase zinc binding domain